VRFAILGFLRRQEFDVPVEAGNAFEKDPKAAGFFARLLEELKPEAGYFSSSRRWVILITKAESHEELTKQLLPIGHIFKAYPRVEPVNSLEEFNVMLPKLEKLP